MTRACVIGTTSWGLTLGLVAARNITGVKVWARTPKEATYFNSHGVDTKQLPKMPLPSNMLITSSIKEAMKDADIIIIAVPSKTMRNNVAVFKDLLKKDHVIISATKGLEHGTNLRMSQVIAECLGKEFENNICALSGPNLAYEIASGLPAAAVIACPDIENAKKAQLCLNCENFAVYTNQDIIGVELAGSFKNIIAIGAGIIDGMGYGDNTKSAFITRALTEMSAFGINFGANPLTFMGLAGLGDTIATCSSPLSRNHFVGEELAKGRTVEDILAGMSAVSEGVSTIPVVMDQAKKLNIEMPITSDLYKIVCEGKDAKEIMSNILGTSPRHELSGRKWQLRAVSKAIKRKL